MQKELKTKPLFKPFSSTSMHAHTLLKLTDPFIKTLNHKRMTPSSRLALGLVFCSALVYGQTPQNSGIGTATPGSKLEIKAESNDAGKSALNVTDNASRSLLFIRNDGKIGIGTSPNSGSLFTVSSNYLGESNSHTGLFSQNNAYTGTFTGNNPIVEFYNASQVAGSRSILVAELVMMFS